MVKLVLQKFCSFVVSLELNKIIIYHILIEITVFCY